MKPKPVMPATVRDISRDTSKKQDMPKATPKPSYATSREKIRT